MVHNAVYRIFTVFQCWSGEYKSQGESDENEDDEIMFRKCAQHMKEFKEDNIHGSNLIQVSG